MKRIIALLLCIVTVLALCACGKTETPPETTQPSQPEETVADDGILKILAIGNSFSIDAMHILYEVAQKEGYTNIMLGNLYIGGCSVATHAQNIQLNAPQYSFFLNTDGYWDRQTSWTLDQGLRYTDWDVITLQQASTYSGSAETYNQNIQIITDYVNQNKLNSEAKMYWHMTWAYPAISDSTTFISVYRGSQQKMYEAICSAVQSKILTNAAFSGVIPVGTAIQNARTSYLGDTFNRDKSHLNDLGRVVAAYTWFSYLTGIEVTEPKLTEVPKQLVKSYEGVGAMPINDYDRKVIAEAVQNALKQPFAVTASQYPPAA